MIGPAVLLSLLAVQSPAQSPVPGSEEPTFTRDIAPILHEHCAPCHRPGQSGPFPLLSFDDARKRASQIVEVTQSRFMPPWLPGTSAYRFRNDRRLDSEDLARLARWAASGTPQGAPEELAPLPEWPRDWQLGEPDLVLELPAASEGFELAADGPDIFRNFVLPNPLAETRYVRALELRPDSPAVHHAIVQVDETPSCEVLDEVDEAPGFPGMQMGESEPPNGHFIGWTPGKLARPAPADMAWRLRPGTSLVVQLHLSRTGKPETLRPRVGLYFTDRAPTRFPYSIVLYREDIDIPPGAAQHTIRDEYRLPTDVVAVAVYPHAHYLGRRVRATVARPDGSREELLRIDDWDFNWQDEYHFAEPVELPQGSLLSMEWVFDNSRANVRNPNHPPRRVKFGQSSADEMGTLTLVVLPREPEGIRALDLARWRGVLARKPYDWHAHNMLGALALAAGEYEEAAEHLERALSYNPEFPDALANYGQVAMSLGRPEQAREYFERALQFEPAHPAANARLGLLLRAEGRTQEARTHFEGALARWPHLAEVHFEYGNLLALEGAPRAAIEQYHAALRLHPDLAEAHNNLANAHFSLLEYDLAALEYERAITLRADYFNAHYNRGRCLLAVGLAEQALPSLVEAARLRPEDPAAAAALREALEAGEAPR